MSIVSVDRHITSTFHDRSYTSFPAPQLLIRGCALLSPAHPGRLLYDQDILIANQRIVAVGPTGSLAYMLSSLDHIIDGSGHIVLPGLINAHTHSLENLLKATSPSLPLELWLVPLFADVFEWSPRLVYLSSLLGALEMLKSGTTGVLDHLWTTAGVAAPYLDATMQAYQDAGIRAAVAPSIEDQDLVLEAGERYGIIFPPHPFVDRFKLWPTIEEQVGVLEQFIARWDRKENGRLRGFVGPSGIHWCSQPLLESCLELASRYQTGIHLHAVETELQAAVINEHYGQGGIRYLQQLGVLKPGTSLAHTIWLEPGDLDIIASSGTTVVHNPVSNLRLGSGRFPLSEALQHGVSIALGSDGSASNDDQNMFGVLKLTGLLHNRPDQDYKQWPQPADILTVATSGGAAALGLSDELGEIAPGQLADLVLLDLNSDTFLPLRDPYLHLLYCEHGKSVDTVIVNGAVVVEDGKIAGVDEQALRQEIREHFRYAWKCFPDNLNAIANGSEVLEKLSMLRNLILQKHA